MVPDVRVSRRTERNPEGIPREGIKMRRGNLRREWRRINLVDIRTEVTNRNN